MAASLSGSERKAVLNALARLMMLANHSLSPTQTKMATSSAEELLWLVGVESHTTDRRTFRARAPEGEVLDLTPNQALTLLGSGQNLADAHQKPEAEHG